MAASSTVEMLLVWCVHRIYEYPGYYCHWTQHSSITRVQIFLLSVQFFHILGISSYETWSFIIVVTCQNVISTTECTRKFQPKRLLFSTSLRIFGSSIISEAAEYSTISSISGNEILVNACNNLSKENRTRRHHCHFFEWQVITKSCVSWFSFSLCQDAWFTIFLTTEIHMVYSKQKSYLLICWASQNPSIL